MNNEPSTAPISRPLTALILMKQNFHPANVRIRSATLRDRKSLLDLMEAYYRYDHIRFDREEITPSLTELLRHPEFGKAWIGRHGPHCIGYVIMTFAFDLEFGGRQAGITELFIQSRFRGKGIGRKLLQEVEAFCQKVGIKSIELQVTRDNSKAIGFYERLGFHVHDRIPMSKRLKRV
jgi:ribosomal protein S18 acetylase RimI-like enzyme